MARRKRSMNTRRPGARPATLSSLAASSLGTPALTRLAPREQEIATIVYLHTEVTARELESALAHEIGNSAIRCMLGRLVAKGIIRRHKGKGKSFVYSPALTSPDVQERALERVAEDYFGGSLQLAMQRLVALAAKREPEALRAFAPAIPVSAFPLAASG